MNRLMFIIGTVDGRGSAAVPLVAASYDVHPKSGQVDVLRYLEPDIRKMVTDPSLLFPGAHAGLRRFVGVSSGQSSEYAKLTMMELTAGKTELTDDILGGGTLFRSSERWWMYSSVVARKRCVRGLGSTTETATSSITSLSVKFGSGGRTTILHVKA